MHSSNTSSCNHNPINTTVDEPLISFPENDISCNFIFSQLDHHQDFSSSLFNFPNSPHMYLEFDDSHRQLHELLYQQQLNHNHPSTDAIAQTQPTDMPDYYTYSQEHGSRKDDDDYNQNNNQITSMENHQQLSVRKRSSKKDRHSKINTARGPRDRRMRLSLEVAKKFFHLQDLLGYDKASRTVDWLMKNSSSSIRELERNRRDYPLMNLGISSMCGANSASSISDNCDVVSSNFHHVRSIAEDPKPPSSKKTKIESRKGRVIARATVGRESRRKARERARERTSQKLRLMSESISSTEPKLLFSESTRALKEPSPGGCGGDCDRQAEDLSQDEVTALRAGENDEALGNYSSVYSTCQWNPSLTLYNYAGFSSQQNEQLVQQFQFCGKTWEINPTMIFDK